ncbi:hypothetical protein ACWDA7_19500 [Streptomyces sp. NPDC001156]
MFGFVTRRRHERDLEAVKADRERIRSERDQFGKDARALASQLGRIAGECSAAKDVAASHIVAARHPSTVLNDPQTFAESLRQALEDAGVDIRLELAQMEGTDL